MIPWQMRFDAGQIRAIASGYDAADPREVRAIACGEQARTRGYYDLEAFLEICRWKSTRPGKTCKKNTEQEVIEATRLALATPVERLRIEILRILHGVEWPTASALLHIGHRDPYPLLDFRALWSLSIEQPRNYSFEFWWDYVLICRGLAQTHGVDMRTLDRALWQFSKDNQPS
ncbi:MAG: hypothetical protein IT442_12455 [Phycisphaeraceae bacterium]|nr:hypothetical protein [Phycisphaeraceae bacterium]